MPGHGCARIRAKAGQAPDGRLVHRPRACAMPPPPNAPPKKRPVVTSLLPLSGFDQTGTWLARQKCHTRHQAQACHQAGGVPTSRQDSPPPQPCVCSELNSTSTFLTTIVPRPPPAIMSTAADSLLPVVLAADNFPLHPYHPYPVRNPLTNEQYTPFHLSPADHALDLPPVGLLRPQILSALLQEHVEIGEASSPWTFFRADPHRHDSEIVCVAFSPAVRAKGREAMSKAIADVAAKWKAAGKFPEALDGGFITGVLLTRQDGAMSCTPSTRRPSRLPSPSRPERSATPRSRASVPPALSSALRPSAST